MKKDLSNSPKKDKIKDFFGKKKNEFLEYMVQDEVYFADLEKIENYYLRGTLHSVKQVNDTHKIIEEKQALLESIKQQIDSNLASCLKVEKEQIKDYYDKQISTMEMKIEVAEKDRDEYKQVYYKLEKKKHQLQLATRTIQETEAINDHFHYQFSLIKENSLRNLKNTTSLQQQVKNFHDRKVLEHKIDLHTKKNQFNELEYKVFRIKDLAKDAEEQLDSIRRQVVSTECEIKTTQNSNEQLRIERNNCIKDVLKTRIAINIIHKSLRAKNTDEIITRFLEEQTIYQNLYTTFNKYNQDIRVLNSELTSNEFVILRMREIIKKNRELENNPESIVRNENDILAEEQLKQIYEVKQSKKEILRVSEIKEKLLYNVVQYLISTDKKLSKIIINISDFKQKQYNDIESAVMHSYLSKTDYLNIKDLKFILRYFSKVQEKIFFTYNNLFLSFGLEVYKELYNDTNETKFLSLFTPKIYQKRDEEMFKVEMNLAERNKLLGRSDSEIFKNIQKVKPILKVIQHIKGEHDVIHNTSLQNLFYRFMKNNSKNNPKEKNLLLGIKTKLMTTINQFTNTFVDYDVNKKMKDEKKYILLKEQSQGDKNHTADSNKKQLNNPELGRNHAITGRTSLQPAKDIQGRKIVTGKTKLDTNLSSKETTPLPEKETSIEIEEEDSYRQTVIENIAGKGLLEIERIKNERLSRLKNNETIAITRRQSELLKLQAKSKKDRDYDSKQNYIEVFKLLKKKDEDNKSTLTSRDSKAVKNKESKGFPLIGKPPATSSYSRTKSLFQTQTLLPNKSNKIIKLGSTDEIGLNEVNSPITVMRRTGKLLSKSKSVLNKYSSSYSNLFKSLPTRNLMINENNEEKRSISKDKIQEEKQFETKAKVKTPFITNVRENKYSQESKLKEVITHNLRIKRDKLDSIVKIENFNRENDLGLQVSKENNTFTSTFSNSILNHMNRENEVFKCLPDSITNKQLEIKFNKNNQKRENQKISTKNSILDMEQEEKKKEKDLLIKRSKSCKKIILLQGKEAKSGSVSSIKQVNIQSSTTMNSNLKDKNLKLFSESVKSNSNHGSTIVSPNVSTKLDLVKMGGLSLASYLLYKIEK